MEIENIQLFMPFYLQSLPIKDMFLIHLVMSFFSLCLCIHEKNRKKTKKNKRKKERIYKNEDKNKNRNNQQQTLLFSFYPSSSHSM